MPTCGVYAITNVASRKIYFGSSIDIEGRFKRHKRELSRGTHHNKHLQRAWNRYGESQFIFQCVEECPESSRTQLEDQYIRGAIPGGTYNQGGTVGGGRKGVPCSSETKSKIGDANRGRKTWNTGGRNTWGEKISASWLLKMPYFIVASHSDGRRLEFFSVRDAAEFIGASRKCVSNCLNGVSRRTKSGWGFTRSLKKNLTNVRWPKWLKGEI